MTESKANVTIYLPAEVLDRCRAAAASDGRSLSNYLSGLLARAHPPEAERHELVRVNSAAQGRKSKRK